MMSRITTVVTCFILLVGALFLPSLVLAGSATISWQANTETDFAKYRVYWSTTAGTYGSFKAEVPKGTTTYVANNLTDGQTYYFVLTAVDTSGNESGFSSPPASKTISGGGTPAAPAAPALTSPAGGANVAATSVTFSWQASQGATDYSLKVLDSTGGVVFDQWLGSVLSRTVTGFANQGQSYTWTVTARNATGQGPASAPRTFVNGTGSTPTTPPGPGLEYPANGATVPGTSITFRWKPSQGATQYIFRQWKQNGQLSIERRLGNVTSFTNPFFSNSGYTNSWSVTAQNAAGQGASSEKWTFTNGPETKPAAPAAPALSSPAGGANVAGTSVTFSWQAAQGATDYNLKVYNSTGGVTFDQWLGSVLSRTVTGFSNGGQSYTWTVTARNATGQSPASAQRSFVNGAGTTPTTPPGPELEYPANGSTVPGTSITFRWKATQGATQYIFRQWKQNGQLSIERRLGNVTSFTNPFFSNSGYTNSWSVTAQNAAGQGASSEKWTFTNGPETKPAAPAAPALSSPAGSASVAGTSVTFSWQAAQGATDYNLKVYSSSGAVTFDSWLGNVLSRTVTGFANQGQSYTWTVTARNATGQGPASAQRSFVNGATSNPTVPPAPALEYPANGSTVPGTSITFRWKPSQGATQYIFRQWKQNGQLSMERRLGNVTSFTNPYFSNSGYTNSWSVTALNAAGQGTVSEKWSFTNK